MAFNFNSKIGFHPPWNFMVWYICMPTWYCELQCNEILLIEQLNIDHKKEDYNISYKKF